jgi:hypothetical protein
MEVFSVLILVVGVPLLPGISAAALLLLPPAVVRLGRLVPVRLVHLGEIRLSLLAAVLPLVPEAPRPLPPRSHLELARSLLQSDSLRWSWSWEVQSLSFS